jgi:hypothetical protein
MRKNWLGHQVWRSYKAIVDACCEAWNKLMQMPERIASLTQRDPTLTVKLQRYS